MNPFAIALAEWVAAFANGALRLDPIARARLAKLAGRRIELRPSALLPSCMLRIDADRIAVEQDSTASPSVTLTGSPAAMLDALARGGFSGGGLEIDGDEVTLAEFTDVLRSLRPDFEPYLGKVLGPTAAQSLVGLIELGFETAARIGREIATESGEFTRTLAAPFLSRAEFDDLVTRRHAAALAIDRVSARLDLLERALGESP